ncbi:nucleotidyltransferase domain-containing protein [Shewanella sp. 0m-8]
MRLSERERISIVDSVKLHFSSTAKVWLFGSRCDDNKRGGDIDLYLEGQDIDSPLHKRILLKIALQDLLGEQKIDLVYHDLSLPIQPIHEIAKTEGILLG